MGKVLRFICDSATGVCSGAAPELKSSFRMRPRWSFSLLLAVNTASKLVSISVPTAGNRSSSYTVTETLGRSHVYPPLVEKPALVPTDSKRG